MHGWVNAGQTLLKARFPNIHGFLWDRHLHAFNIVKEGFVQVLHTGRGHWVTVSTIGCSTAEVDVYDSLPPSVSSSLQNQLSGCIALLHKQLYHYKVKLLISCYCEHFLCEV